MGKCIISPTVIARLVSKNDSSGQIDDLPEHKMQTLPPTVRVTDVITNMALLNQSYLIAHK